MQLVTQVLENTLPAQVHETCLHFVQKLTKIQCMEITGTGNAGTVNVALHFVAGLGHWSVFFMCKAFWISSHTLRCFCQPPVSRNHNLQY